MRKLQFVVLVSLSLLSSCAQEKSPPSEPMLSGRVNVTVGQGDAEPATALEEALLGFRPMGSQPEERRAQAKTGLAAVMPPPSNPPLVPLPTEEEFVGGQAIVKLRPGALEAIPMLHERPGLEGFRFELGPWASPDRVVLVFRPEGLPQGRVTAEETRAIVQALSEQPEFEAVELNYIRRAQATVNDPLYEYQWHLHQLGMERAWDITTGSEEVVVAVLDTGLRRHPDLDGRVLPGYDMVSDLENALDGDGRDPDPSPAQEDEHGLMVAGTVGAVANNGLGIAGMDWKAKILPVRVIGVNGAHSADVIAGIYWAIGAEVPGLPPNPNPAKVLNMSLGGGTLLQAEQEAVLDAVAAGAIVIVAAGNENMNASLTSYGGYEGVIVVGATDFLGHRSPYSNWGPTVDVMAPGGHVQVDRNGDGYGDGVIALTYERPTGSSLVQGTSFAAPHVAGLVALMLSLEPELGYDEVLEILTSTADPGSQCSQGCGAGRIDPVRALQEVARLGMDEPPSLQVEPTSLQAGDAESLSLRVENVGGHPFSWRATVRGPAAAHVRLSASSGMLGPKESTFLEMEIGRDGLDEGFHRAEIEVTAWGDVERIPLVFSVGDVDPRNVGEVHVFTFRYDAGGAFELGAMHRTRFEEDYRFSFASEPGEWFLAAWADLNGDGAIDAGDHLAILSEEGAPRMLRLEKGQKYGGLEFFFAIPDDAVAEEAPCAGLRRCWEDCGEDAVCADACAVEEKCRRCYQEKVRPCQRAAACDAAGQSCCDGCGEEYEACFGKAGCELELPWIVSGGVGSPCRSDRDCDSPYRCDTSVSGGYCTMPCNRHQQCPGGLCVRLRDDAAFCLASCSGGGCPRPQDECALLTSGAFACFPEGAD